MSLLRRLGAKLSEQRDDFLIAKYLAALQEYASRERFLPVTAQTLARFALLGEPTEKVRSLLEAYRGQISLDALSVATPDRPDGSDDVSSAVLEILIEAHIIGKSSRGSRDIDAGDVLVSLARHPVSSAIIERLGLTELRITYFLSHGRPLPPPGDELEDLPERAGEVFVRVSNDDYTRMELVTKVLAEIFALDPSQAQETMLKIHRHREAFLGPYAYEEARTKASNAIAIAREAGAPLLLCLARTQDVR